MKCAIMQPTYLPWAGFFNLILEVDIFVFLDDAQYQKSSWHSRNVISNNGSRQWITVPVKHEKLSQKINETLFANSLWKSKHIKTIEQTYAHHEHIRDLYDVLATLENDRSENLADLNITLIKSILKNLSINAKLLRSSDLGVGGERSSRLVEILSSVGATEYLSPIGARQYLEEDSFEAISGLKLSFQDYKPKSYGQKNSTNFLSHLSVVDLIANIGSKRAYHYVASN